MGETALQMVQRHVRQGEAIILRQRKLVAKIIQAGRDPSEAENILAILEDWQNEHVAHLERILPSPTAAHCSEKATDALVLAAAATTPKVRELYTRTALEWAALSVTALVQEKWDRDLS